MLKKTIGAALLSASMFAGGSVLAGGHTGGGPSGPQDFADFTGFEGQEKELGAAIAKAILEFSPNGNEKHDFTDRERELGEGVNMVMRSLNVRQPYQHEVNDALVKITLNYVQFAKDNDMMDAAIDYEIHTQRPMLERVARIVDETGDPGYGLMALTDRTACFYQLALEVERGPDYVTYREPFGNVLSVSVPLDQHDLTPQEIHEIWTIPRFERQAAIMGLQVEVSPIDENGRITIRVPAEQEVAAVN